MHRKRTSQRQRLIGLLRSRKFQPVSLPEIQRLGIAQHSARFNELRELGFIIRNTMEHAADGTVHSYYTLVAEPGETMPLFCDAVQHGADDLIEVSRHEMARMRREGGEAH